jgi:hypothetical protein
VIVLGTNVLSERLRVPPNQSVFDYVVGLPPETVFTTAVCEAELQ